MSNIESTFARDISHWDITLPPEDVRALARQDCRGRLGLPNLTTITSTRRCHHSDEREQSQS
jgi:hypothetical protein